MHECMRACGCIMCYACVHVCACVRTHECMCTCVHTCMCVRVHMCMCAVRACVEEVLKAAAQRPLAFQFPVSSGQEPASLAQ